MRFVLLLLILFSLFSCDINKWNGYSQSSTGLYYKIHSLGEGDAKAKPNDKVYAEISIFDSDQKLLYRNGMQLGAILFIEIGNTNSASISEALSLMHSGDSASFIFPNKLDAKLLSNGKINEWQSDYILNLKLNRIVGEYNKKNISKPVVDLEINELKKLHTFLVSEGIDPAKHTQGVYLKTLKKGKGSKAQSGQNLWINYTGRFLDGTEFDNTNKAGQLLDFQLGKPDQVIKAFEIALHHVQVGGIIQVVTPSQYAFGEKGSSTGIVPPNTSVVYTIELVRAI